MLCGFYPMGQVQPSRDNDVVNQNSPNDDLFPNWECFPRISQIRF